MIRVSSTVFLGLVILLAGRMTPAQGTDDLHPLLTKDVIVDVGMFFPDRDVDISLDGTITGANESIDFGSAVNLGNSDEIFAMEIAWRFSQRWSLLVQYFDSKDSGGAVLAQDIEWGDFVFGAGTGITAGFDVELLRLFVGRKFDFANRHDFGFGGGIHSMNIGAFIEGTIIVNGMQASARRELDEWAPLPNIGAWYRYSLSPRWAFRSRLDLLSASVGDYSGLLFNGLVGFDYTVFEWGGIGISYSYFLLDVEVERPNWRGDFESEFDGLYIYLSAYF